MISIWLEWREKYELIGQEVQLDLVDCVVHHQSPLPLHIYLGPARLFLGANFSRLHVY